MSTRSEQRRLFREHVARIVSGWKDDVHRADVQARAVHPAFARHKKAAAPVFRPHHVAGLRS